MKNVWFRARKYGWGWRPIAWQGWVALALYVVPLVATFIYIDAQSHSASDTLITFSLYFLALSFLFLSICYQTGEIHHKKTRTRRTKRA